VEIKNSRSNLKLLERILNRIVDVFAEHEICFVIDDEIEDLIFSQLVKNFESKLNICVVNKQYINKSSNHNQTKYKLPSPNSKERKIINLIFQFKDENFQEKLDKMAIFILDMVRTNYRKYLFCKALLI
jgi:hypothetical protein